MAEGAPAAFRRRRRDPLWRLFLAERRERRHRAVEPVRISEGDVRWLKQTWSSQWLREPTADELKGLVDDLLKEKLLAREARGDGPREDDTIIRRRLAQKLEFLVEDTAQLAEPTEASSASSTPPTPCASRRREGSRSSRPTSIRSNAGRSGRRHGGAGRVEAKGEAEPTTGDRLLFGDSFDDTDELALSQMFGADFAHAGLRARAGRMAGADQIRLWPPSGLGHEAHADRAQNPSRR